MLRESSGGGSEGSGASAEGSGRTDVQNHQGFRRCIGLSSLLCDQAREDRVSGGNVAYRCGA